MKKILGLGLFLCLSSCSNVQDGRASKNKLDFDVMQVKANVDASTLGHKASTLLVSCIDFRLREEVEKLMEEIGLEDNYDEVVLPGASVSLAGEKYVDWAKAADEVIKVSKDLHEIKQVIILDHKDCGAFKIAFGKDKMANPANEKNAHKDQMRKAIAKIKAEYPDLKVYVYIMSLDGTVENWTNKL